MEEDVREPANAHISQQAHRLAAAGIDLFKIEGPQTRRRSHIGFRWCALNYVLLDGVPLRLADEPVGCGRIARTARASIMTPGNRPTRTVAERRHAAGGSANPVGEGSRIARC